MGVHVGEDEALWQALDEIVKDEGVRLYDLEVSGDRSLRVTIDKPKRGTPADPQHPERVTSGDCSTVCRRLMVYFEVEGPNLGFSTEPQIEVSSPGVNRNLRLRRHFRDAVGERVKVVFTPVDPSAGVSGRPVIGPLEAFAEDRLTVRDEQSGAAVEIPLGAVKRASVEFKF